MEIELIKDTIVSGEPKQAGALLDLMPALAEKLIRRGFASAPGQQMPSALGTLWGAVNAVTYVVDHELGRNRSTALRNAWLGHTANTKRRAMDLALKRAS